VYEVLKDTDKSKRWPSAVGSVSPQSTASSSSRQGSTNMTETHQVFFILKTRYQNPHDRISHIGGLNSDGTHWNLTLASAVDAIERSKWKFYLMRNGTSFDLIVATTRLGNKYLKTTADRQQPIGLLALPACAVTVVASATPASGVPVCQRESSC
jgi:hypothetical protein